jgi:NifB/MoaA-like Fe-S oxidoreductase
MLRLHTVEFEDALADCETEDVSRHLSIATGMLAKSHMEHLASLAMARFPSLRVDVHAIVNHFFGETITVSGLVTGGDLIAQLKGKELGDTLLIPENMLRHEGDLFLDNVSVADVENALHVTLGVTSRDGEDLLHHFLDN